MNQFVEMQLINDITNTLLEKFPLDDDADMFLEKCGADSAAYEIMHEQGKRAYLKHRLYKSSKKTLLSIADQMEIRIIDRVITPPKNWESTTEVKAFISHLSADKKKAKRLKDVLKQYNINSFVAHEDITPTKEWQIEIENALQTMDFFISLHVEGFSNSFWCQQEVGFAVAKGVLIIPIKFSEEDPVGFISKFQAMYRGGKTAEIIGEEILDKLKNDRRTSDIFIEKIKSPIFEDSDIPF
mgnify:CR=1 FL=1